MATRRRMVRPTPRRRRVWADQGISAAGIAEDVNTGIDLLAGYVAAGGSTQGVTVARTIVSLTWVINEAHTFNERFTVGLYKGTQTAADVADVVLESYADWAFLLTSYAGGSHGSVAADAPEQVHIDTPAMRKIEEVGETWWLIFQGTAPGTASATYDVRARIRTLLLLP